MIFRYVSCQGNQNRASRVLDFYGISRSGPLPIDPEVVLRKMKVDVIPEPRLYREHGVKGFVAACSGRFQVYIDEYHYDRDPESSRFTLGEELGHVALHTSSIGDVRNVDDWFRLVVADGSNYRKIEGQAKLFASNIMLPNPAFEARMLELVRANFRSLKRSATYSIDGLAFNVAFEVSNEVGVSHFILNYALTRWPDRVIDRIVQEFPELMGNRLEEENGQDRT